MSLRSCFINEETTSVGALYNMGKGLTLGVSNILQASAYTVSSIVHFGYVAHNILSSGDEQYYTAHCNAIKENASYIKANSVSAFSHLKDFTLNSFGVIVDVADTTSKSVLGLTQNLYSLVQDKYTAYSTPKNQEQTIMASASQEEDNLSDASTSIGSLDEISTDLAELNEIMATNNHLFDNIAGLSDESLLGELDQLMSENN